MSVDGVEGIPVSLEEVLEVRNGPLTEDQVWAILARGVAPLQELSDIAGKLRSSAYGLIPSSVFILSNGSVRFTSLPPQFRLEAEQFLAPESRMSEIDFIPSDYSKVFIYSFGAVLHYALTYQDQTSFSSAELFSLINMMMINQAASRPTLNKIGQMSDNQIKTRRVDVNYTLKKMFESIMGAEEELDDFMVSSPLRESMEKRHLEVSASEVFKNVASAEKMTIGDQSHESSALTKERQHGDSYEAVDLELTICQLGTPLKTSSIILSDDSHLHKLKGTAIDRLDSFSYPNEPNRFFDDSVDKNYLTNEKRRLEVSSIHISDDLQQSQVLDDSVFGSSSITLLKLEKSWNLNETSHGVPFSFTDELAFPVKVETSSENTYGVVKPSLSPFDDDFSQTAPVPNKDTSIWSANLTKAKLISLPTTEDQKRPRGKSFDETIFNVMSEDLISYKDHGRFERSRPYCSVKCYLCCVNKQPNREKSVRTIFKSLPNLVFESRNSPTTTPRRIFDDKMVRQTVDEPIELLKIDDMVERLFDMVAPPLKTSKRLSSFSLNTPEVTPRKSPVALLTKVETSSALEIQPSQPLAIVELSSSSSSHFATRNFSLSRKESARLSKSSRKIRLNDLETEQSKVIAASPPPKPKPRRNAAEKAETTEKSVPMPVVDVTVSIGQPVSEKHNCGEERFPPLPSSKASSHRPQVNSVGRAAHMPSSSMKMSGPEFLLKCRMPSIRLKALSSGKPRHNLFRHSHSSNVLVILLSGQKIDVSCNTMTTAGDVFDAVMTHTNLSETIFFGLTYLKDGEHYFLESEDKLYKFAPTGWKDPSQQSIGAKITFTIYLRIKCYPPGLEFVRNELTIHQLYLQLRRDLIDARLKCSREDSCTLAALALQAEYGDRTLESTDYFQLEHYLPHRHVLDDTTERDRLKKVVCEIHGQYAGLSPEEAENEFLQLCKSLREYGIHFHRLFKSKPSPHSVATPLGDPETGVPVWIGVMPRGVIILEERSGERIPISQHPWHSTQTLQFDRKKFIIVPKTVGDNNNNAEVAKRLLFFADSCKKTSYFVHFAATQHRFCMRMKAWVTNGTLETVAKRNEHSRPSHSRDRSVSSATDSGISREASPSDTHGIIHLSTGPTISQSSKQTQDMPTGSARQFKISEQPRLSANLLNISEPSMDTSLPPLNDTFIQDSLAERLDSLPAPVLTPSDYDVLNVKLVKDSRMGLGLTLVDGEIQGVRGVYIKSLNAGGPAELNGRLKIGDRITVINENSLENMSRHDAVEIVRSSPQNLIHLEVMRLRSLYSSDESLAVGTAELPNGKAQTLPPNAVLSDMNAEPNLSFQTQSRTLPTEMPVSTSTDNIGIMGKFTADPSSNSPGINFSPRTHLHNEFRPADTSIFNVDSFSPGRRPPSPAPTTTSTPKHAAINNLLFGSLAKTSSASLISQSPAILAQPPSIYGGLEHSSDEDEDEIDGNGHTDAADQFRGASSYHLQSDSDLDTGEIRTNDFASKKSIDVHDHNGGPRNDNVLDWTDEIDMADINQIDMLDDSIEMEFVDAILYKNERGSLGIKIAGGKGQNKVYVKSLVDEPAISCNSIKPGDRILSVNDHKVDGMSHHDVVALLKSASSPVKLGLCRPKDLEEVLANRAKHIRGSVFSSSVLEKTEKTLEVTVEKPATGSLGLSLARPTGVNSEGIYIKHITAGSVVETDGRLKVGDRLWEIDGQSVASASPAEVVEKLKAASGSVHIVVKRVMTSGLYQ